MLLLLILLYGLYLVKRCIILALLSPSCTCVTYQYSRSLMFTNKCSLKCWSCCLQDTRLVYKTFATLYFIVIFDDSENELAILDLMQGISQLLKLHFGFSSLQPIVEFNKIWQCFYFDYLDISGGVMFLFYLEFQYLWRHWTSVSVMCVSLTLCSISTRLNLFSSVHTLRMKIKFEDETMSISIKIKVIIILMVKFIY